MTDKTLLQALLDFQQEAIAIVKDSKANYGKYVSLPKLIEELQPALNRHGLLITQFPSQTIDGQPALTSILAHAESGETREFTAPLLLAKLDPQANGSALTYMRRYSYAAITQVVIDEDDDGQRASAPPRPQQQGIKRDLPAQQLCSAREVGELSKLRKQLGLSKQQYGEVNTWLVSKGWTFGKWNTIDNVFDNSYVPLEAVSTIEAYIKNLASGHNDEPTRIDEDLSQYSDEIF